MNLFIWLARLILWIAPVLAMLLAVKQLMQFVQLSSYQAGGYLRTIRRLPIKCFWPGLATALLSLLTLLLGQLALKAPPFVAFLLCLVLLAVLLVCGYTIGLIAYREKTVKVRLVFTNRIKRLYVALLLVGLLATWLMYAMRLFFGSSALLPFLLPLWLLLAMLLTWPVEKGLAMLFRLDASRILSGYKKTGLVVIGITGSYGKTTVKNILYAMLSQMAPTLASPASFNTPLGLSRAIREDLGPQHRFFIAEMGARHPQDIRVLCRMVGPSLGILTSIGPQHLQTLGSIQKVRDTKYELIRALPKDGFAVFNDDGRFVSECWQKTTIPKALVGSPGSDIWAEEVELSTQGSAFTICLPDGRRARVKSQLSGEHNVRNILLAASLALHLGLSLSKIALALEEVAPIPSRLASSVHPKGFTVINNGFNSNPDSSRKALEVLAAYPGRLVVVTPGFIELGRQERRANRRLGNDIAAVADLAILIGHKRTRPVKEGLLESGMAAEDIEVFASLHEASIFIEQAFGPGDVLLYENDLPDHYL